MKLLTSLPAALLLLFLPLTHANVEKTIFLAPSAPDSYSSSSPAKIDPSLDDLGLETLSPGVPLLRTRLNASFPAGSVSEGRTGDVDGEESWFLLEELAPGVRYEVRVCWLATQPTSFTLTTHTLSEIIDDPALLAAVSRYSNARLTQQHQRKSTQRQSQRQSQRHTVVPEASKQAILFLRIHAAADYFTLHDPLMRSVPPVLSDIILDPYLGNIFPRSLVPTACWGLVVGVLAVAIARWVVRELGRIVLSELRDVPPPTTGTGTGTGTVEGKKGR